MDKLGSCELIIDDTIVPDIIFKGILIGEASVGKSCILHRIVTNEFKEDYDVTIGAEFSSIIAKLQGKTIKLQVWDTAGQENFRSMIRVFYKGSHAAFLVYDITKRDTFDKLETWVSDIKENALPDVKIILLGNKKDEDNKREVAIKDAKEFCDKFQLAGFHETSAKTGEEITNVFSEIAKILYVNTEGSGTPSGNITPKDAPQKLGVKSAAKIGCC